MAGTLTTAGLLALAKQAVGIDAIPAFTYIALDSSATAESAAHTGPQAEITTNGGARKAGTATTETGPKSVLTADFEFTGDLTIAAVCWMNAATEGTMLGRALVSPARNVANSDTVSVVMKLSHSQSA